MVDDCDEIMSVIGGILALPLDEMPRSARTGLSQPAFAKRVGVPIATLRNWEQRHRKPQGPVRVLLALLDRNPHVVKETLGQHA